MRGGWWRAGVEKRSAGKLGGMWASFFSDASFAFSLPTQRAPLSRRGRSKAPAIPPLSPLSPMSPPPASPGGGGGLTCGVCLADDVAEAGALDCCDHRYVERRG